MPDSPAFTYCSGCTPGNYQTATYCVAGGPEMKGRMYFGGKKPGEEGVPDALESSLSENKWAWDAPGMTDQMTQYTSAQMNTAIKIGPDMVPLPTFIETNRCSMGLTNWNDSGICTQDPLVEDALNANVNAP